MRIGIIILCRSTSKRLPNKISLPIEGTPALLHTVKQAQMLFTDEQIVVATSNDSSDDKVEELCQKARVNCFRGSLDNVAERFLICALHYSFDFAIRLNGDNIFVNRDLMKEMANVALKGEFDFLSNVHQRTYPKGLSIEIVRVDTMLAHKESIYKSEEFKEHVLFYFYQQKDLKIKFFYNKNPLKEEISFALDTADDLERIKSIIKNLGDKYPTYNYKDITTAYEHLAR